MITPFHAQHPPWITLACVAALLAFFVLPTSARAAQPTTFYVATNGNDAWSGHLPAPNAARTDGPFATIAQAQAAVRTRIAASQPTSQGIDVQVRGGFYALDQTLTFAAADSGTATAHVVWEAFPGESPVLSGGTRITGWKHVGANRWETTIPDVAAGKWRFSQLYVNGERRYRPRLPKTGYFYSDGELPSDGKPGIDRVHYADGPDGERADIRADWHALGDTEILPFHTWEMSRFHVTAIDTAAKTVSFEGRSPVLPPGYRFLIENVGEAMTEPGQWYLDRATGLLTYLAAPGEDPNHEIIVAPRQERLVEIDDATGLMFRRLTFADSAFNLPPQGQSDPQADINVSAAIHLNHARFCTFESCTIRNLGGYAVEMDRGSQDCRVTGCELTDLGAGGVRVGVAYGWKPDEPESEKTVRNVVSDCRITHGGRIHPAAVGILLGNASYTTVTHNTIADFYYTGISVGWSWGYGPSGAHHNTISYNDIRQIGQGVLSDMGGIYTLGVSPGTVVDHNRIQDVVSYDYGGWGIYFDEGTTGIIARDNVAFAVKSEPFHQHYGTENIVENCIFALGREAQLRRSRGDNGPQPIPDKRSVSSFTIRRCVVYSGGAPLFDSNWSGANFGLESNLYWSANPKHPAHFPGNTTLEAWQAMGHDAGSLVADPLFADPLHGDFTLRAGSPAAKIGFQSIDLRTVGPRTAFATEEKPAPRAFPPPPAARMIVNGFESASVGAKPDGPNLIINEETDHPDAHIRVTDEAAFSGVHSLKFQDAPGQRFSYSPHLYYHPSYTTGTWTGRFALRLEPGAIFYHEWRDSASPYNVGPSLTVGADDQLTANGRPLLKIARSQWIKIAVTCTLGDAADGTYDLAVQLPGEPAPHHFSHLPCGSGAAFSALDWWGFVANSTASTVFYLDDLSLTAK